MPKDFKIGMTLGLVLVIIATLWLASRPSLNPQARTPSILDEYPVSSIQYRVLGAENNQLSIIKEQSKQPDFTVYTQAEKIKTTKFHIVRKGETLSAISHKHYGSANRWQEILDANRSQVKNANTIKPGTKLIIPE